MSLIEKILEDHVSRAMIEDVIPLWLRAKSATSLKGLLIEPTSKDDKPSYIYLPQRSDTPRYALHLLLNIVVKTAQ